MAPLSDRMATAGVSPHPADGVTRPTTSLVVLLFAALAIGVLVAFAAFHVAGPIYWRYLWPKPSSVFAFLERVGLASYDTPGAAGPFSLHMWCLWTHPHAPNVLIMTLVAVLIGWLFPRVFLRLSSAFVIGACFTDWVLVDWMECPYVVAYALGVPTTSTRALSPLGCVLSTVVIYGPPFLSAWIASRWSSQRFLKGHCQKCDYLLKGLPTQRCPECGTPFEVSDGRSRRRLRSKVTAACRSLHRGRYLYLRCLVCAVLFAAFLCLPETLFSSALRDAVAVLLSYSEAGVVATSHEGFPALAVGGRIVTYFTAHCTHLGLVLILSPFLWGFGARLWRNAARIAGVALLVQAANLVRCWAMVHYSVRGTEWLYAHDVPNYAIWSVTIVIVVMAAIRRDYRMAGSRKRVRRLCSAFAWTGSTADGEARL